MKHRAVITGIGVLSPIGNDRKEYFQSLRDGRSGITEIISFDISQYKCKIGGEIKNFDPQAYFSRYELRRLDKASWIVLAAAIQAVEDGQVNFSLYDSHRCRVILGSTLGGMISGEKFHRTFLKRKDRNYASLLLDYPLTSAGNHVARTFNIEGGNCCISTACSSGTHSIGYAANLIEYDQADIIVAGGFDTMAQITYAGFGILRVMDNEFTKPFDKERKGLNLGEGVGILIIESLEKALQRNARIYAEVIGYGASCDAYHMTAPSTDGAGAAKAIEYAIQSAGIEKEEIDYINAHGTGTKYNDIMETKAIKCVFGARAYQIPISSTKSLTGHTLGASGSLEAISAIFSISEQMVHPTINYQSKDPECDLDYVPNIARQVKVDTVLSNSFGFGGNNASIILRSFR